MNNKKVRLIVILLMAILLAVLADITVRVLPPANPKQQSRCLAVPAKFIMEYPDCADKLVQAANLTNIHIIPPGTLGLQRYNQSVKANKTSSLTEDSNVTHPKVCIEQWRQELISMEDALYCIDEYTEKKDT